MAMTYLYVKNAFVKQANATLAVQERGFRFGDGVFETIRIANAKPQQWSHHLKRLKQGLSALHIPQPTQDLQELANQLIAQNNADQGVLRISLSRAGGSQGYLPTQLDQPPTLVMETLPLPQPVTTPYKLWLSQWRKTPQASLPTQYKVAQGVNSTLARIEAHANKADEALLLTTSGHISEASSANIFWQKDGEIFTPCNQCDMLQGIARERLLEAWNVTQGQFTLNDLAQADSVIICNSIRGAASIAALSPNDFAWHNHQLSIKANEVLHG